MIKKILVVKLIVLLSVISLSGCIMTNDEQTNDDIFTDALFVSISGDQNFTSIQDAIDAASNNTTIYVFSGTYEETLIINKRINLMGENPEITIIDGNKMGNVIEIKDADYCNISGFTIQNCGSIVAGIEIETDNNNISDNIIKNNNNGINARRVKYNSFFNNRFISNINYAVYIYSESDYNIIENNIFLNNSCGLRVKGSRFNIISNNIFKDNEKGMYFCCSSKSNVAYYNDFINNSLYGGNDFVGGNIWHNEELSKGNYWDDYGGVDKDNDGIGEIPYKLDSEGIYQDPYPFINPINSI